jgi:DNA repair protein SbcC/Rad50
MRPIVLDMNGFASFREAATIDFADADFFALVGPTGSGKSTVIDAMTFALYGSVPRWGRKGMVSLALAPTTARGTVRLVFEVDGRRYVVARELRRLGSQVNQKAASLERLAGPRGRGAPGEPPTEVLAKDLAGVGEAVERLLGLSYEDFCQCVVLPQGQFADFLHAKPNDRQEIMLRLLGAEHYRQMMVRANQRASDAGKRAETLEETLAGFGDASADAEEAARTNEAALAGLADRVDAAVPRINAAGGELAAAEADLARLQQDRAALAAVRVPGDVAALDAGLGVARAALGGARIAEDQAAEADAAARAALSGAPQRAPLELARQRRAERDRLAAAAPSLRDELARLTGRCGQAEAAVKAADATVAGLRERRDAAVRATEAAGQRVHDLSAEHATLASVAVPDGVAELDARRDAAITAGQQALTALEAAEQADSDARAACAGGLPPGPLEAALRDARDLAELVGGRARARAGLDRARARRAAAEAAVVSAEADREQRQASVDDARRAHAAAGLRPHLVAGQACPVCEQPVATLPPPLDAPAIEDAQARLGEAVAAAAAAQAAARQAAAAEERAAAEFETLTGQRSRRIGSLTAAQAGPLSRGGLTALAGLLADAAGEGGQAAEDGEAGRIAAAAAELEAAVQARHALDEAANAAGAAVRAARSRAGAAQAELDRVQAETVTARGLLRDARDPLVGLGAPAADADSLAAAWELLAGWAGGLAQQRAADLAEAREAAQAAAGQRDKAQDQFGQAEADLAELRDESANAGKAEQEAKTRLGELTGRIAELSELLADAPDDAEITAQLALRDELEAAASGTGQRLLGARAARGEAERELAGLERAGAAARSRLAAARDPLVGLGAPALDAESLLAGWTALQAWAAGEAAARDQGIGSAREQVTAAGASVRELTSRLGADLAASGIELAAEAIAPGAATAVARALERARAETRRIAERRALAADLAARRDAAQDEQRVARLLGDLLRSDRFPRWLVTAALDTLVAEASVNLAGLTNDQFDLTQTGGEFYVIDHADADSRRSVRTLSGGETFQASLALALALSSQMSTLAAAGAARLDSIFLDEGFGTLDPETLEVVASTLETLAQGQRMVGVVTHVAALAERVPVRFAVTRDSRTSRVVREGAADSPDLAAVAGAAGRA